MATGFRIGGEGDLDQIYVTPAEMQALRDAGRLTLQIQSQYGERRLWAWGDNTHGQLGLGNITSRSSPVLVGVLTNWKSVLIGAAATWGPSAAIKSDGSLWMWGSGDSGVLGLGDTSSRSSPVQVGSLTNWAYVDTIGGNVGQHHTLAIKTDGTLWAWGRNDQGQLGLGDLTDRSSPVQVGSLTNWKSVALSASHTLAVKTDGTLWAWGLNTNGALGLDDTSSRSSPVQVGSLTTWAQATCASSFSMARKTDGTLWAWGSNAWGQLGVNDVNPRSSPVQVGSLTTWAHLATGAAINYAVKTDGTLWAWGYGADGRLGLGDLVPRSSPVQVGSLTNWAKTFCMGGNDIRYVFATKTDGTLWAWGENVNGRLGLGDLTTRSSPVQVGTYTDWVAPYLRQS